MFNVNAIAIATFILIASTANAFGTFKFPNVKLPWDNSNRDTTEENINNKALKPGDTIAVIGASGNVGKLVTLRLSDTYNVNGIVRDASSVKAFFEGRD